MRQGVIDETVEAQMKCKFRKKRKYFSWVSSMEKK